MAELLVKLAALDPGGKYANGPLSSLGNIFRLWMPQTYANSETRLKVLDRLRKVEPEITWKLLLGLLPRGGEIAMPTPQARWRDFSIQDREEITWAALTKSAEQISERLFADVENEPTRWEELIKHYAQLSPEKRKNALEKLSVTIKAFEGDESSAKIWAVLREILNHHRSFPDANWSLPQAELDLIEKVYLNFEPADSIAKSAWLFCEHIAKLPQPVPNDWEANQSLSFKLRCETVQNITDNVAMMGFSILHGTQNILI